MSTTSSQGRRPFGKPATSPPRYPSRFAVEKGVGGTAVFSRSSSAYTSPGCVLIGTPKGFPGPIPRKSASSMSAAGAGRHVDAEEHVHVRRENREELARVRGVPLEEDFVGRARRSSTGPCGPRRRGPRSRAGCRGARPGCSSPLDVTVPSALIVREAGMLTEAQPADDGDRVRRVADLEADGRELRDGNLESRREDRVAEERVPAAARGADAHARPAVTGADLEVDGVEDHAEVHEEGILPGADEDGDLAVRGLLDAVREAHVVRERLGADVRREPPADP